MPAITNGAIETKAAVSAVQKEASDQVAIATSAARDVAWQLQNTVQSTTEHLSLLAISYQQLSCLQWLCHFDIVTALLPSSSRSYSNIADECNVPVSTLKAVARMAITHGFLKESPTGELTHSEKSLELARKPELRDWVLYMAGTSAPVAARFTEATERFGHTDAKYETAYNVAKCTDLPFFDHLGRDEGRQKQFAGYMRNVTTSDATSMKHLLEGFDWAALSNAKVVDVGGSSGHASIALATVFPGLSFVVQDLPDTIANSNAKSQALDPSVRHRVSFTGHDFFTPQPVKDADVYLLRMIVHDWPRTHAKTILQHLADAMKPCAQLVIMDTVLPPSRSVPPMREAMLRVRDLTMRQTFNSSERELEEWHDLFSEVRPQLKLERMVQPDRSSMAILVVTKESSKDEKSNGDSSSS